MRAGQDNSSQCLKGSTQGQRAETLQAMKRGRINECPNLDLVINKEEPRIHQQDDSGANMPEAASRKAEDNSGKSDRDSERTPPRGDGNSSVWLLQVTGTSENPFSSGFNKSEPRLRPATHLHRSALGGNRTFFQPQRSNADSTARPRNPRFHANAAGRREENKVKRKRQQNTTSPYRPPSQPSS